VSSRFIQFDLLDIANRLKVFGFSSPRLKSIPVLGNAREFGTQWSAIFENGTMKVVTTPFRGDGFILYLTSLSGKERITRWWPDKKAPKGEIESFLLTLPTEREEDLLDAMYL